MPPSQQPLLPDPRARLRGRGLVGVVLVHLLSLGLSLVLHMGLVVPMLAGKALVRPPDTPGDLGPADGPTGTDGGELLSPGVPVNVSIYQAPTAPSRSPQPAPSPTTSSSAPAVSAPSTGGGTASTGQGQGAEASATPTPFAVDRRILREGIHGKPARGKKKPCEKIDEIVKINDTTWRVERGLMDWYAIHLHELEKQAGIAAHRDADGKRDGMRLYLPRCSLIKQGGFRNRDVIHKVNGHKVNSVAQGVATWLKVRGQDTVTVEFTRGNDKELVHKIRLIK